MCSMYVSPKLHMEVVHFGTQNTPLFKVPKTIYTHTTYFYFIKNLFYLSTAHFHFVENSFLCKALVFETGKNEPRRNKE